MRARRCFNAAQRVGILLALLPGLASALTLSEALQLAGEKDPAVSGSRALLEAERQLGSQERATRLPQLSAIGRIQEVDSRITSTPFRDPNIPGSGGFNERYRSKDASVELRQPLFRFDFLARGDRADALDELAEANGKQREQALMVRVADRYLGVLRALSALEASEQEAASIRRALDDTRLRYEVQLVPGTDLKEAQARDDLAQAALLQARQAVENAQDLLEETTGRGYDPLPRLSEETPLPALDDVRLETWQTRTQAGSPLVRQAQAQLEIAKANLSSSRSAALPTLDAVGTYGYQDTSESRIGGEGSNTQYGVELRVPLFSSGGNRARIREAAARHEAARGEFNRVNSEVRRETRRLVRQVTISRQQAEAFERALTSAEAAEQATRYGYEAGKRTLVDVLNAKSALAQARRQRDEARYGHLLSALQLKQYAGGLTPADFALIDTVLVARPAVEKTP